MGVTNRSSSTSVWRDVLGPWLRWPLYSPRRVVLVLSVVTALVFGASRLSAALSGIGTHPDPAQVPAGVASTTTHPVVAVPSPAASPPGPARTARPAPTPSSVVVSIPPRALSVTEGFMAAWARPNLTQPVWWAGVRPYLSVEVARSLAWTDPARVPASKITGRPYPIAVSPSGEHPTSVESLVATNAGTMRVRADLVAGRWVIGLLEPESLPRASD